MIPDDAWRALDAYRSDPTAGRWTALSQMWVGDIQVLDALQQLDPQFPDPLPLPVDGLIENSEELFQWKALPAPDDVQRALLALQKR